MDRLSSSVFAARITWSHLAWIFFSLTAWSAISVACFSRSTARRSASVRAVSNSTWWDKTSAGVGEGTVQIRPSEGGATGESDAGRSPKTGGRAK